MANATITPIKSNPVRNVYRFGGGPEPVLQFGTMGWTALEMEDPVLRRLWDGGRYEILDGVLTMMPASLFIAGQASANLLFSLKSHLRDRNIPASLSTEVELKSTMFTCFELMSSAYSVKTWHNFRQ